MRKLNKGTAILLILAISFIIWGCIGHFVCRIGYSTRKPINYDKTKVDTVTFDDGHTEVFKP